MRSIISGGSFDNPAYQNPLLFEALYSLPVSVSLLLTTGLVSIAVRFTRSAATLRVSVIFSNQVQLAYP